MIPLGPFNGKNFATTVSPWVITLDSLTPFRTELPTRVSRDIATLDLGVEGPANVFLILPD